MPTNLPNKTVEDSAAATRLFFDVYGKATTEFAANEVSAAIAFFETKGFDKEAAVTVSSVILNQAKADGVPVFTLLDSIKGFTTLQLNSLITEILNNNRPRTSTLGFRLESIDKTEISRNIAA
jgi:hypothetical protein